MKTNITALQPTKSGLPSPEKAFEWPQQAVRERNWSEAAQRWAVLRKAYPNQGGTWIHGAIAHIEAGELERAEPLLTYARQHFTNYPSTFTGSAMLAMHQHKWDAAENFLRHAREQFPGFVQTWMKSAEYAEHRGDLEQATAYNEKACQCATDLPGPFIQHAELAMRAEQWEQALKRWETLRSRFPDLPAGYLRAAEAARQLGRPKQARQLSLAHQYGAHIFDSDTPTQSPGKQRSNHTNLGRLMELIWTKAIFNLRSEVHRNYLSYGWWVLEPVLHMVVYYVVFGLLLQRGGENYPVFLLTGLIPWMWFMKAVSGSSGSILSGHNLMLQVGLPSIVFPLVNLLQATIKQLPVLVLLFGFVWVQGYSPGGHWWALFPVIFVQALLIMAFACTVAAVIPFARDLSYLVPTGLTFLMFLSGIFYDYRMISIEWRSLFLLNPVAFLLKCYRDIFIDGVLPDLLTLTWWGLGSAIACLLLILVYKRLRYIYPRIVME
jgi:lipopolysaccharide transport system permease protein